MSKQSFHFIDNKEECDKEKIDNLLSKIIIKQIACGYYHAIILDQNKNIYTYGRNGEGQLGLGHNEEMKYFEQVNCPQFNNKNNEIKFIAAGGYFTIVITLQNESYGTGMSFIDSATNYFTKIEKPDNIIGNITKVKCGSGTTIVMNEKKELFGCGINQYSLLGQDAKEVGNNFLKLNLPEKVKDFNCSYGFTTVLMEDGDIYCSGVGLFESYENFTKIQMNCRFKQISSLYESLYCLTDNNELYYKTNHLDTLQKININCKIKKIYTSLGYILYILDENNTIYKVNNTTTKKEDNFYNLPYLSIYPGNNFAIILNSNIEINDDGVLEESKEVKRMKMLLFENSDKISDIKMMFY